MTRGDVLPHVALVSDWMVDRAIFRAPRRACVEGFVASLQQLFAALHKFLRVGKSHRYAALQQDPVFCPIQRGLVKPVGSRYTQSVRLA